MTKHYVLQLVFEPRLLSQIEALWEELLPIISMDKLREQLFVPHISLVSSTQADLLKHQAELKDFFQKQVKIQLAFNSIGTFGSASGVLFIAASYCSALKTIHSSTCNLMKSIGIVNNKFYTPESFMPHCSLLTNATATELQRAFAVILEKNLPIVGNAIGVDLVEYFPGKHIDRFPFHT